MSISFMHSEISPCLCKHRPNIKRYIMIDRFFIVYLMYFHFNVILFPGFPSRSSISHPPPHTHFYQGAPPPTHPLPPHHSSIPLRWGIKPPQDQGPPLPLTSDKVILYYICIWSQGSLHVYSLVGGLVPGRFGGLLG